MKKNIILLGSLILSSAAYSQVGIDTQDPKATLDVVVTADKLNKPFGIIAPRVTGTQLRNAGGQFLEPQDGAIVYATSSAETTTGRAKDVTQKGYYYYDWAIYNGFSQGLWVALKNAPAEYVEPWYNVTGGTPATSNTASIYQLGKVGIGTNSPRSRLHLGGENTPTLTIRGEGDGNTDSYPQGSISFLESGTLNWGMDIVMNSPATTTTPSFDNLTFRSNEGGTVTDIMTIQSSYNVGTENSTGRVGIGTIAPTNKLHVYATADPVKLEGLQTGASTDQIVTVDENGVLKKVTSSSLPNSAYQEPWVVQGGTTPATTNSQAISQNASVAIGKSTAYNSTNQTMLDVAGAVRVGTNQTGAVGTNSLAIGDGNTASGSASFASGQNTTASGNQSTAVGNAGKATGNGSFAGGYWNVNNGSSTAAGQSSFAFGEGANAKSDHSLAFGNGATAIANHAVAIGVGTIAPARSSITLGRFNVNTFTSADITQNAARDPIFQLGSGSDNTNRWNTVTSFYLPNSPGWLAIGQSAANTMPERSTNNERLRVYGGVLSNASFVSDINTVTGASTDKLVVADATTGQLKTITSSSIAPTITSNNGLTKTGDNVQLGGDLVKATSIGTNGTVTLALTGLQNTGITSDKIIVSSTNGVLKTIDAATVAPTVTADNGLTKTGNNVQLGGNLVKATSIGTNGTVTLALTGLQNTGTTSDKIIVSSTNGVLKTIDASSLPNATYQEPWNQAGTTTPATANNQAIFQNGAVSIWRNKVFESTASGSAKVDLHVNGATRVGGQDPDVAKSVGGNSFAGGNAPVASGNNSMAYGTSVEASGTNSAAFGNNSKAVGTNSLAIGDGNTASGSASFASGQNTTASGNQSTAVGNAGKATGNGSFAGGYWNVNNGSSTAAGQSSFAFGEGANAKSDHSLAFGKNSVVNTTSGVVLGSYNELTNATNALFQLGNGTSSGTSNAITVLTDGKTGIGTSAPSQKLDVNGASRLRGQIYDNNNAAGANGQVLSTNSSGQVVWQNNIAITPMVIGVMNNTAPSNAVNSANYNTGAYIDLPAGKWVVNATLLLTKTGSLLTNGAALWIRAAFSTNPSSFSQAENILSGSLVGPSQFGLMNGIVVINNASGSIQRYYLWRTTSQADGTATGNEVLDRFAGGVWAENQIVATPVN